MLFIFGIAIYLYADFQRKEKASSFSKIYIDAQSESIIGTIEKQIGAATFIAKVLVAGNDSLSEDNIHAYLCAPSPQDTSLIHECIKKSYLLKDSDIAITFIIAHSDGYFLQMRKVLKGDLTQNEPVKELPLNADYIIRFGNNGKEEWFYYNKNDKLMFVENVNHILYDPRSREWYKETAKDLKSHQTEPYFFGTIKNLVSTYSEAITSDAGNFLGIVGVDINVRDLSLFLANKKYNEGCLLFIIDDKNNIIASSRPDNPMLNQDGKARPIYSNELNNTPEGLALSLEKSMSSSDFTIKLDNTTYMCNFSAFSDSFTLMENRKWRLLTIVPSSFLVTSNIWEDALLYIFVILILMMQIIIMARRITNPLEGLNEEMTRIQKFDFRDSPDLVSRIYEVSNLWKVMKSMKHSLASFTKYMPKSVVMKLIEKNETVVLGGEQKTVTILFTDIAGFTTISESFSQPKDLILFISEYFEVMTTTIIAENGTIDKYIGDAIMAFWGAPDDNEMQAFDACRAALICQHAIGKLNVILESENKPVINTRIGIHKGEVVVGNMGSSERMNYTVIGDSVNLAARLEGINKYYDTKIIISEDVYQAIQPHFLARVLDIVAVKGKSNAVRIYELLGQRQAEDEISPSPEQEKFVVDFDRAFNFYMNMNFEKALQFFNAIKETNNLYPSTVDLYIKRCGDLIKEPPTDDWRGVTQFDSK
jgi:adenylate cyclase